MNDAPQAPDPKQLSAMLDVILDGGATEAQMATFIAILEANPAAREYYVQASLLRAALMEYMEGSAAGNDFGRRSGATAPRLQAGRRIEKAARPRPKTAYRWYFVAAAALLVLVAVVAWPGRPVRRNKLVGEVCARWGSPGFVPRVGHALPAESLDLVAGLARVRLASGVDIILQGPTRLKIKSPRLAELVYGLATATVPKKADGFTIRTRSAQVVDLGTKFSVKVAGDHSTFVQVLRGKVEVSARKARGSPAGLRRLTAGHAAVVQANGVAVAAAPVIRGIVRNLAPGVRVSLPLDGTGVGLKQGEIDPRWRIKPPNGKPIPAYVCPQGFVPNDPLRGQWLSTAGNPVTVPPGIYHFITNIPLDGVNPATVRLHAEILADDQVRAIRVNGVTVVGAQQLSKTNWQSPEKVTISGGLRRGNNRVDFVVLNKPWIGGINAVGLRVSWTGTGVVAPRNH